MTCQTSISLKTILVLTITVITRRRLRLVFIFCLLEVSGQVFESVVWREAVGDVFVAVFLYRSTMLQPRWIIYVIMFIGLTAHSEAFLNLYLNSTETRRLLGKSFYLLFIGGVQTCLDLFVHFTSMSCWSVCHVNRD